jgi:hypothetical protein
MIWIVILFAFVILSVYLQNRSYDKQNRRLKQLDVDRLEARAARTKKFIEAALTLKFLPKNEPIFHLPVYDANEDTFICPCKFRSFDGMYEGNDGIGWVDRERIQELMEYFAFNDEQSVVFLDYYHHLVIIKTESLYTPGGKVYRIARTDLNRWHVFCWYSGTSSGNRQFDPVFHLKALSSNPEVWQLRQNRLQNIWEKSRDYQVEKSNCTHGI